MILLCDAILIISPLIMVGDTIQTKVPFTGININLYRCPHEGVFPSKSGDLGSLYNQSYDAKICAKTGVKITNQRFKFRRLLSFVL